MESTSWLIVAVIGVLAVVALAVLLLKRSKGESTEPDYRVFFIIGISWLPIGIATENIGLVGIGVVFMLIGLAHRDEWKDEAPLTPNKQRLMYVLVGLTVLMVLATAGYLLEAR